MIREIILICTLFIASTVAPPPSVTKVYRPDYVYNKRTDAFYKFHIDAQAWSLAERVCKLEGAALMLPSTHEDIVQLHGMFKQYPDLENFVWVADDGQTHESAEEEAIINLDTEDEYKDRDYSPFRSRQCDVVTRKGEIETSGCYRSFPFICKVSATEAPYSQTCDVFATGYKMGKNVSSCYKIPSAPLSWNHAYAECRAEGAHLVVLNSQAEHDAVLELMNTEPKVMGATTWWFFHAGFRAEVPADGKPKVFKTIFNETLEAAGFNSWSPNEPNNALNNENCGTLFKNDGKLNDVDCSHLYGFICEKEVRAGSDRDATFS